MVTNIVTNFTNTMPTEPNSNADNSQPCPLNISNRMDQLEPIETDPSIESSSHSKTDLSDDVFDKPSKPLFEPSEFKCRMLDALASYEKCAISQMQIKPVYLAMRIAMKESIDDDSK